jgi:hypothetical protein
MLETGYKIGVGSTSNTIVSDAITSNTNIFEGEQSYDLCRLRIFIAIALILFHVIFFAPPRDVGRKMCGIS